MAFTKPFTYVDGNVLSATQHASNEDALKEYVNQEILANDISDDTVVGESIAAGRFVSVVQTGDFVSKTVQGVSKIRLPQEFAWFTSTTKGFEQTNNNVQHFQPLNNTGSEVVIYKANTKVMVTFYAKAFGALNSNVTHGPDANKLWDNIFQLQYETNGVITRFAGTRGYVFENSATGSSEVGNPDPDARGTAAGHRSIMITRMLTLNAGRYKFAVAVNSKLEKGQINCQTFTIETFHV